MDLDDIIRVAVGRKHSDRYTLHGPRDGWKGLSKLIQRVLIAVVALAVVMVLLVAVGIGLLVANFDTIRGWFSSAGQTAVQRVEDLSAQWPEQKQRAIEYVESMLPATRAAQTPAAPAEAVPSVPAVPAATPAALPEDAGPVERPEG